MQKPSVVAKRRYTGVRQIIDKSLKKSMLFADKPKKRTKIVAPSSRAIKSTFRLQTYLLIEEQILTFIEEPTELNPFCQPVLQTKGGRAAWTVGA